jgi:hypothetical protein
MCATVAWDISYPTVVMFLVETRPGDRLVLAYGNTIPALPVDGGGAGFISSSLLVHSVKHSRGALRGSCWSCVVFHVYCKC